MDLRKRILVLFLFIFSLSGCGTKKNIATSPVGKKPGSPVLSEIRLPPYLKKGDTVMIVAPAGYVSDRNHYIERGDSLMRAWGLVPVHGKHLFDKHYQFAGTDSVRLADLQAALDAPNVKAIWAARGGYGSIRIINKVDWTAFRRHPKWVIGFSDITVILNRLLFEGYASVHGIMPISLAHPRKERESALITLKNVLFGKKLRFSIPSDSLNKTGSGEGIIVGGNLSMLVSMLGSDMQLNTDGKILFLEDVHEKPYSYDRMLYALANAGYFDHLQALIVGDMSTKKGDEPFGETVKQMILKHTRGKNYPVVFGFPAGHVVKNYAVVIGKYAKVKVTKSKVYIRY